ncbi:MAG: hypothetical protein HW389_3434 [Bacteroidetes bacterium]|nr:hypothetical protein [Bacteroidota bacterium]
MTVSKNLFIALILILLTGCSDQQIQSNWARRSPTIDGNLEEWNSASLVVFEDLEVSVGVGNDTLFLYLAGRLANATFQRMVGQSGLVIWLDPEGGRRKGLEIHFPASRTESANLNRGLFYESLTVEQKARAREKAEEMARGVLVINRKSVESRVFLPGNVEGFSVAIAHEGGLVSFEARIPLQIGKLFSNFSSIQPGRIVGIGVGLSESRRDLSLGGDLEGAVSMSQPGLTGRSGSPGGFGPGGSREPLKKEIWLEVGLAQVQ